MPSNDNFSNAQVISGTSGSVAFDLTGATAETGEPVTAGGTTVWFAWTAPSSDPVQFDTTASSGDPDTYLAVYTGSSVSALTSIAEDDDSGNNPGVGDPTYGTSLLTFTPTSGTTYYIQVDDYDPGIAGVLTWGPPPAPPPPVPTATSWDEATGRPFHTAFPGDVITVTGTDLDTVTTVTINGLTQGTHSAPDSTHLTITVGANARSGPIEVSNSSGSATPSGDATIVFAGPWIQPGDIETSLPDLAHAVYRPADESAGANIYPSQPDLEGETYHDWPGAYTEITVRNQTFPDPSIDPTWDWHLAGGVMLALAPAVGSMPPIDYTPILAADPTIWDVESEATDGVAVTDVAVSFHADDSGAHEWADSTDDKSPTDISGDLWQTAVEFRRLDLTDWTWTGPELTGHETVELTAGAWPSKTWIAALPLDLSVPLVESGDTLEISSESDSGTVTRHDNRAIHGTVPIERLVPTLTLTWAEYVAGVAWLGALDRLVGSSPLSIPFVEASASDDLQRKNVSVNVGLLMTWTYRPPRYRLLYEEPPVLTAPPLRQLQRDDETRHPLRNGPTSTQASLRRGPRGTYL